MSKTLREQLVGAWRLVSYVEKDVETGVEDAPMGEKPEGIIMYTPDGYVSAQLCAPNRHDFADGDQYKGTPDDLSTQPAPTWRTRARSIWTRPNTCCSTR